MNALSGCQQWKAVWYFSLSCSCLLVGFLRNFPNKTFLFYWLRSTDGLLIFWSRMVVFWLWCCIHREQHDCALVRRRFIQWSRFCVFIALRMREISQVLFQWEPGLEQLLRPTKVMSHTLESDWPDERELGRKLGVSLNKETKGATYKYHISLVLKCTYFHRQTFIFFPSDCKQLRLCGNQTNCSMNIIIHLNLKIISFA